MEWESTLGSCSCHGWWHQQERKVQRLNCRIPQPGTRAVIFRLSQVFCKRCGTIKAGAQTLYQPLIGSVTLSEIPDLFPSGLKMGQLYQHFRISPGCCGNPMRSCLWACFGNYRSITPLKSPMITII